MLLELEKRVCNYLYWRQDCDADLKMMAGLVVVSMWAAARLLLGTTHWALGPQKTRTKAS